MFDLWGDTVSFLINTLRYYICAKYFENGVSLNLGSDRLNYDWPVRVGSIEEVGIIHTAHFSDA